MVWGSVARKKANLDQIITGFGLSGGRKTMYSQGCTVIAYSDKTLAKCQPSIPFLFQTC